jgi:hypothetical protein
MTDHDHERELEPTTAPKTSPGIELVEQYPPDALVRFAFAPEPDLPDGLDGVGRVLGVIEDVYDDGDGESGPHLHVYIALALEHEGETYHCHPEDGSTRLELVELNHQEPSA